jgi:hypothetical protein
MSICLRRAATLTTICLGLCLADCSGGETERRLTGADRHRLVESICAEIDRLYPHEDIALRTREGLLEEHRSGGFDSIDSPQAFASRLTESMEELSHDRHLDLYYNPTMAAELLARERAGDDAHAGPNPTEVERARWEHFGFKELKTLDGNVVYLDLRVFFAAQHAADTAVAAMDFMAGSSAVIIDLRRNGGGWDDMVTLLASYFVRTGESRVLSVTRSRLDDSYWASMLSSWVPGRKLVDIPVYLLISGSTASAAEAFASILDHVNDRVVLVGETTAGAENPVENVTLDHEFVLKIPCYEKIYFGTREGWEGKGIQPDIEVPAEQALETAHLHALRSLRQQHGSDEVAREMLEWAIDGLKANAEPFDVPLTVLETYAGRYRGARILLEGSELLLQFDGRPGRRLLAVNETTFVVEGRDDLRVRFVREDRRTMGFERMYADGYRALVAREQ